ncbi:DUF6249 domain-containing protein [Enhygromyxa salina]|uniref:DUF6249 domain-containing protein n=1 Tax=Enhygromyxa salina TaxID=215803 RepID=A0A2S9YW35_9BACT|nr:DUF6249 domain-containing protein [Enhygromyxa salina]PRQ09300.1 hypothetical protein ENSA7_09920 [Enhygromyxa salina]
MLGAALVAWGVTGSLPGGLGGVALAGDLTPLVVDTGIGEQGCSGALGYLLEFDSMLFETRTATCSTGFRPFDLAFLAVVALIVISVIRFRHATTRHRLDLARRMVEKGIEPPPELVGANNGSDLRRGIVLVCTGLGLLLASMVGGSHSLSPAGLIPGFIGIGYLVSHRFAVAKPDGDLR